MRGRLYSGCVQSSILHGSETWPIRKENEVALQQTEMRMVRWMCVMKLQDRIPSKTRVPGLLGGIDCVILCLAFDTIPAYDRQVDRQTRHKTSAYIALA